MDHYLVVRHQHHLDLVILHGTDLSSTKTLQSNGVRVSTLLTIDTHILEDAMSRGNPDQQDEAPSP